MEWYVNGMLRQFKYFNSSAFQYDLKMAFQRHYNLYNYADPNHAWEVWKTIFLDIANMHAPLRIRKVKSEHCPWMTNEITLLITMKLINVVEMNLTKESKQLRFNFATLSYKTVKIVKKVGIQ